MPAASKPRTNHHRPAGLRPPPAPHNLSRAHPTIRTIAAAWRRLTGGKPVKDAARRTLIACSGGADSCALAIALAVATGRSAPIALVIAHVVHDLRPRDQALADRDAARALAATLNIPFIQAEVKVKARAGNPEALARRERYKALTRLARAHDCPFVATAHHADDQLETLLMRLIRGAGPRGLRAVHETRKLSGPLTNAIQLIRPMLNVTRASARQLCADAAVTWREDATNADTTRTRSAIRHTILPALEAISPRASIRASRAARQLAQLHDLLTSHVDALWTAATDITPAARSWPRTTLRAAPEIVLGELLRTAHRVLIPRGQDRLTGRTTIAAVNAIRSSSGESKRFNLSGLMVEVASASVRFIAPAAIAPSTHSSEVDDLA